VFGEFYAYFLSFLESSIKDMVKAKKPPKPKRKISKKSLERKTLEGVASKSAVRRLARRGGVKRFTSLVVPEMQIEMANFVKKLVHDAIAYAEHGRRSTVTASDVLYALRHRKMHLYGYN